MTATTMKYDEMVLEVEFVADSGTYSKICGITGVTINRTTNLTETNVPNCTDETKPHEIQRDVSSIAVTMSGTGVWAQERHHEMMDWFYAGSRLNARLRNTKVETGGDSGDIYAEQGPCLLTALTNERPDDKGRVTATVELAFDGTPTRLAVA